MNNELRKLLQLNLHARVAEIISREWGVDDSDVVHAVATLGVSSRNFSDFKLKLDEIGAECSESTASVLWTRIERISPKTRPDQSPPQRPPDPQKSNDQQTKVVKESPIYDDFEVFRNAPRHHTGIVPDRPGTVLSAQGPSDYELFEIAQLRNAGVVGDGGRTSTSSQMTSSDMEIAVNVKRPNFLSGLQRGPSNSVLAQVEISENSTPQPPLPPQPVHSPEDQVPRGIPASKLSISVQRKTLPIYALKDDLLKAVAENKFLVLIGETGSGKTTQLTQYLLEAGYSSKGGLIACTQPRRVAAVSVAKRVAEEVGGRVGDTVGYCIRFEDKTSDRTVIKYMTDGMLLREVLTDRMLTKYSVLILDEAHERTVNTDILFGLCKTAASARNDLRIIVTSATLDAEKFSAYFYGASVFTIPGRMFPVSIECVTQRVDDYVSASLSKVLEIHLTEGPGDILLFLTGQEEIDSACQILNTRQEEMKGLMASNLLILPVYSALPGELQSRIFEPAPKNVRKCVIATNVAEASLTIDGIMFVIDPGYAKVKVYNAKAGMDSLVVSLISQASARQRAGRAGRTGPGKCYRLYTEQLFKEMQSTTVPELQRSNLCNVVLMLKAMGIDDVIGFDFMDKPPTMNLLFSLENLWVLGALDDSGALTILGRKMAAFPMDPEQAKCLLASVDLDCAEEVVTIIALLSEQSPLFYRPRDKAEIADQKKAKFHSPEGDHCTLLEVYKSWMDHKCSSEWCADNFVQFRTLRRAQEIRKQLVGILEKFKLPVRSAKRDNGRVRKAICAGFFNNACKRDAMKEGYSVLRDEQQVFIHPSSALARKFPDFVVYHELVQTSKEYMRNVCLIEPQWLVEVAPNLFRKAEAGKLTKRKQVERIQPLHSRHQEPDSWRLKKRLGY